uniref:Uncharacterized protein n=1 Tax=Tanacetum cinerariifolium TaxID=118510 RepID=A0A699HJJ3_TANCI|nr:hypothetical protein [Tanacetum cinerariifolium]
MISSGIASVDIVVVRCVRFGRILETYVGELASGFTLMSIWIISRGDVLLILLGLGYSVLRDLILHRSSVNNSASLSNKFKGFYFIFMFGISGLLHQVITAIADRIRVSEVEMVMTRMDFKIYTYDKNFSRTQKTSLALEALWKTLFVLYLYLIGTLVNERQMQKKEEKVDMSNALDASLVDTKSSGTESGGQDTCNRSGNDAHADDTDIRPIYDEEPMAEEQLIAKNNVFAIGQQHNEQPKVNNEGEVDQNAEQCHDTRPLSAKLSDN